MTTQNTLFNDASVLPTRLMEIVGEVNTKLETIQQESVEVGLLLIEAKEELKEQGGSYAEFIEFCRNEFNISKAQASKLMKVASVFADDKRFQGVAMRVLYALACDATEDELDKAAEFAASGTLNTAVVNQLLNPVAVKQSEPKAAEDTPETAREKELSAAVSLANVPERSTSASPAMVAPYGETQEDEQVLLSAEIQELRGALDAANTLIKELTAAQTTRSKASNAPILPQFKSKCAYAVLGLTVEQSTKPTAIKKAFREIIKCGYGSGHEVFEVLTKAKDDLLSALEA